jgi:hypothetical protein
MRTRITVEVKVLAGITVTLVLESRLLSDGAVSERNVEVAKVLEEVNLFLG